MIIVGTALGATIGGFGITAEQEYDSLHVCRGTPGDWGSAFRDLRVMLFGIIGGAIIGAIALPLAFGKIKSRGTKSENNDLPF